MKMLLIILNFLFITCNFTENNNKKLPIEGADIYNKIDAKVSSQNVIMIDTMLLIEHINSQVELIDSQLKQYVVEDVHLTPYFENWDPVILKLYHSNYIVRKFIFNTFEEGGKSYGEMEYYFDINGELICSKFTLDGIDYYEVFIGPHEVLKYSNNYGKMRITTTLTSEMQLYVESFALKDLNSFIAYFPGVSYKTNEPSPKSSPILITSQKISLKSEPKIDSEDVLILNENESLVYLGNSNYIDVVNHLKWVWYRVVTDSGDEGWVFGHPSLIRDYL